MVELVVGDLVVLRSGGPVMTIGRIFKEWHHCVWFADGVRVEEVFLAAMLVKV